MKYQKNINQSPNIENTYFKKVGVPLAINLEHIFEGFIEFVFEEDFYPGSRFSADIVLNDFIMSVSGDVVSKVRIKDRIVIRVKIDYIPDSFMMEMEHMITVTNHFIN